MLIFKIFGFSKIGKTINLKLIRSFGEQGTGVGQFHYPWDVAANYRGDIAVSDSRNRRVQVFNIVPNTVLSHFSGTPSSARVCFSQKFTKL